MNLPINIVTMERDDYDQLINKIRNLESKVERLENLQTILQKTIQTETVKSIQSNNEYFWFHSLEFDEVYKALDTSIPFDDYEAIAREEHKHYLCRKEKENND